MHDVISRQAAIDAIVAWAKDTNEMPDGDDCIMIIGDLPSAQPEIVRCKDCANASHDPLYDDLWCDGKQVDGEHYCSYAERRTDEAD